LETCVRWTTAAETEGEVRATIVEDCENAEEGGRPEIMENLVKDDESPEIEQKDKVGATTLAAPSPTPSPDGDQTPLQLQSQSNVEAIIASTSTSDSVDVLPPLRPRSRPQKAGFRWPRPISVAFGRSGMLARDENSSMDMDGTE